MYRLKQKSIRINALVFEKKQKDELNKCEKIEREQLLNSQIKNDESFFESEKRKKEQFARNLKYMHMNNLKTEKDRIES